MVKKLKVFNSACKHGLIRSETCDKVDGLIQSAGLPNLKTCDKCTLISSMNTIMNKNGYLALNITESLGILPPSVTKTTAVRCPVINNTIVTDCNLPECAFHTTYPGVKNCALVYMQHNKLESLDVLDLSLVLGFSTKTIMEKLNIVLTKMRKLTTEASTDFGLDPQFLVIQAPVCYTCEKPVNSNEDVTFHYCSESCEKIKPKHIAKLEAFSGVDIKELLTWTTSKYANLQNLQQALDISTEDLDWLQDLIRKPTC
jgi:hypothetical protein